MTSLLPPAEQQFCDQNGAPYAGGTVALYVPGTLTPKNSWQDAGQTILNPNPIVLDAAGRAIIFGLGSYRMILADALGNTIYDQVTSSYLGENVVSTVMLPVVGAATLQAARDAMGVTAAIQQAVAALTLLAGPTGPTGPRGAVGALGPTGPAGSAISGSTFSSANPGYWKDTSSGFMVAFGQATTGGSGSINVNFPILFQAAPYAVVTPVGNPTNLVPRLGGTNTVGINVFIEDTDNHGGQISSFCWIACGF